MAKHIYGDLPDLLGNLNDQVANYNKEKNLSGDHSYSAKQLLELYRQDNNLSAQAKELQNQIELLRDLENVLPDWSMEENTFTSYIDDYVKAEKGWLVFEPNSTSTLDALAFIKKWNVHVLQNKDKDHPNNLEEIYNANSGSKDMYILFNGRDHFDALDVKEEGEWNNTDEKKRNKKTSVNPNSSSQNSAKLTFSNIFSPLQQ